MKSLFPDYKGFQPTEEELLKAPEPVQKFVSIVVDKLNEFASKVKKLTDKIKVQDKLLKAKDALLKKKDALIASLSGETKDLKSQITTLKIQIKQKDAAIKNLSNQSQANSTNSNLPPSKDPIGFERNKAKKDGKCNKSSGQKAKGSDADKKGEEQKKKAHHSGATRPILPPTQEENCLPEVCPHCGCRHFIGLTESSIHQHIELAPNPLSVTHFHIYAGTCPSCGKVTKGKVPLKFRDFFGPRISSFVAVLDSMTATTRRQLQTLLKDIFGFPISQGGIQNIIDRASSAIEPHYKAIAVGVRKSLYNHSDETSWRTFGPTLGKLLHWLWVLGNAFLAFFMIDPHRSQEAFDRLVGEWKGLLQSDDFACYRSWKGLRQTCLAHFIREAKRLTESSDAEEAACGKRILSLLQDLCSAADKPLSPNFWTNLEARTNRLFTDYGDLPGKAGGLVLRLYKALDVLTLFLKSDLASKTNNFAEGLVRTAVCQRKVSIGSAAEKGERWIERSLSLRKSCALNGKSYFDVMVDAIASQTRNGRPNLYWIHKASVRVTQKEFLTLRAH